MEPETPGTARFRLLHRTPWLRAAALVVPGCLALVSGTAAAERELDVNIHDDAAELSLLFGTPDQMALDDGRLGGHLFFNDNNDISFAGSLHVEGPPAQGFSPLQFGAGVKGYGIYLDEVDRTVAALGLGASARLRIPSQVPQALVVRGHAAPSITSFGRADRLFEVTGRYELDFTPQASAYVGYRYFRVAVSGASNQTVDSSFHIGVRVGF